MFHKEGYKIILIAVVLLLISILAIDKFVEIEWLGKSISVVFIGMFILILQFFRNPKRPTDLNENKVISPVDGKVVVIEEVYEPEFLRIKDYKFQFLCHP